MAEQRKGRKPDYVNRDDGTALWLEPGNSETGELGKITFNMPGHQYWYARELPANKRSTGKDGMRSPDFKGPGIKVWFESSEKCESYAHVHTTGHQRCTVFYNDTEKPQQQKPEAEPKKQEEPDHFGDDKDLDYGDKAAAEETEQEELRSRILQAIMTADGAQFTDLQKLGLNSSQLMQELGMLLDSEIVFEEDGKYYAA